MSNSADIHIGDLASVLLLSASGNVSWTRETKDAKTLDELCGELLNPGGGLVLMNTSQAGMPVCVARPIIILTRKNWPAIAGSWRRENRYAVLKMLKERNEIYSFGAGEEAWCVTQSATVHVAMKGRLIGAQGQSNIDVCSYAGENAHAKHADEQQKEVRDTLLAQGRILKSGQGRGIRYAVLLVEKPSKKGKKA